MKYLILITALGLGACSSDQSTQTVPTETLVRRPWLETLVVDGAIETAANTQLPVPGIGWESRTLIDMVPDASLVKKGQVIARFDAPQSRMELSQAETELLRKALGETGVTANREINRATLFADQAKVDSDLELSQRYANVDLTVFTRNAILDVLQDVGFLNNKRGYLSWKTTQVDRRSNAERAVIESQKNSVSLTADQKRKSLAALEIIAPHDGVFLLSAKWDGSKPQVGGNLWSGEKFGVLPNLEKLVARFSVEEERTFGLKVGLPVRVRLAGTGDEIDLKITKIDSSASTKSRESPVKYSEFEAEVDRQSATRLALKPGQAISGTVRLIDQKEAITIPNLALVQEDAGYVLFARDGNKNVKQKVELGLRGAVRSEIKSGVKLGAQVLLIPATIQDKK